jgi:hypothetical protein
LVCEPNFIGSGCAITDTLKGYVRIHRTCVRPVGVNLGGKGYNVQEENNQLMQFHAPNRILKSKREEMTNGSVFQFHQTFMFHR